MENPGREQNHDQEKGRNDQKHKGSKDEKGEFKDSNTKGGLSE